MFSIFNKREAVKNGKGRASGYPAGIASSARKASDEDLTFHLEIPVDDAMRALDSRLSSLSHIEVGQAAKERGWATLHRELERHPVRPAAPALLKGTGAKSSMHPGSLQPVALGHSRGWRVAVTSAGAIVVILAAVLGVYGAGLLSGGTGPVSVTTTAVVAESTPDTTEVTTPNTENTAVTDTTVSTEAPVTTETSPVTTETVTTDSTLGTTPTSGGGTTVTTKPNTPTTKPASTTTTGGTINVSQEKVKDAKDAAWRLGDAVVAHFMDDGDIEAIARMVATSARSALTQMIASLEEPTQVHVLPEVKALSAETVRITLEFTDINDSPRFFITVHVTDQGATITAISAAS